MQPCLCQRSQNSIYVHICSLRHLRRRIRGSCTAQVGSRPLHRQGLTGIAALQDRRSGSAVSRARSDCRSRGPGRRSRGKKSEDAAGALANGPSPGARPACELRALAGETSSPLRAGERSLVELANGAPRSRPAESRRFWRSPSALPSASHAHRVRFSSLLLFSQLESDPPSPTSNLQRCVRVSPLSSPGGAGGSPARLLPPRSSEAAGPLAD